MLETLDLALQWAMSVAHRRERSLRGLQLALCAQEQAS
jgi:hypothetical protein